MIGRQFSGWAPALSVRRSAEWLGWKQLVGPGGTVVQRFGRTGNLPGRKAASRTWLVPQSVRQGSNPVRASLHPQRPTKGNGRGRGCKRCRRARPSRGFRVTERGG